MKASDLAAGQDEPTNSVQRHLVPQMQCTQQMSPIPESRSAKASLDVLTITSAILGVLGKPASLIRHVEDRPGHDRRYAVDCTKLERETGWAPRVPLAEGLRRTVERKGTVLPK